ncbi:hypothetical protein EXM36_10155 [Clostridium botulinum]|uniref:TfoX/Sxy family DNA transformation protein n=3 Tax=Clostridium botulinum TaxID=1491 RepID=A0A6B3YA40_CLOBO|nr:TfoX/Sxy family DNA transformation protein [Clostridium botulinum]ACQ53559.1 conserved hypothetical protein [Clostridium botulinum Ba4 str. 657]EDT85468.1 conserved hypothetical protein [Clostridium botulinum Bf]EKN42137.1 hypothetical protein CFSAN001627_08752 [Clostridium botulinum CFSAN001627]AJE12675.1 hypothetical protein T259_3635 [Clostridium botulinum CDC_1436]AXG92062.1 hypothetical protein AGE29_09815 [Clostridium botulinum]
MTLVPILELMSKWGNEHIKRDELKDIGTEQAWLKIQEIDSSACIHRLLALEGAIQGVKKTALPQERKAELKDFYNWHKCK